MLINWCQKNAGNEASLCQTFFRHLNFWVRIKTISSAKFNIRGWAIFRTLPKLSLEHLGRIHVYFEYVKKSFSMYATWIEEPSRTLSSSNFIGFLTSPLLSSSIFERHFAGWIYPCDETRVCFGRGDYTDANVCQRHTGWTYSFGLQKIDVSCTLAKRTWKRERRAKA